MGIYFSLNYRQTFWIVTAVLWYNPCPRPLLSFCSVIIGMWLPSSRYSMATVAPYIKLMSQAGERGKGEKQKNLLTKLVPFLKALSSQNLVTLALSQGEAWKSHLATGHINASNRIRFIKEEVIMDKQKVGHFQLLAYSIPSNMS